MVELETVKAAIKKHRAKRVLLHLPAGYGPNALEIVKQLESVAEVLIWAPPCYGACDVPFAAANSLGADLIVTFGHSAIRHKSKTPVIFVQPRTDVVLNMVPSLEEKRIGLLATIQYLHLLPQAAELFYKQGKLVFIGKHGKMTTYDGQVTGCDFASAKSLEKRVDAFLLFAEGQFHPQGLANAVSKTVYTFEPVTGAFARIEQRRDSKINFLHAKKNFGILVSTKPGQFSLKIAEQLKKMLEKKGKMAVIFAADTFTPDLLNFSEIDVLITTACPRMRDDGELFGKPVLTAEEVLDALKNYK